MTSSPANLAQRLGHGPDARLVIINCDDLGSSHAANLASLEAMERGIATSGTLMVPCPWAYEAVELFRGKDVGVHLTLTAEYPTYRWRALTGAASLHDEQGFLPRTVAEVVQRADPYEVRRECRAQIEQALAWGVDVTHLDSHMGTVQLDPRFFEIYAELASEFRLPLRMVGPSGDERLGFGARARAAALGLVFTDLLFAQWGRPTDEQMRSEFPKLSPGVSEFLLHPVQDGPELRGYDLTEAEIRVNDYACAMDPEIARLIAAERLTPISFRPLRELQRSGAPAAALANAGT
ncbi:MAG: polysaccharide deacetylase family protein [Alphaproteobacteria bacterium]|nr:polysaccharide deacetylase family protein [Alphaproteobacteria bacterium]